MKIFAEYYPAITGNPNIATPQLLPDKIESNNIDPTQHVYNPDTGELFATKEDFFKMQKEQPDKAIFIVVRNPEWMKQWPHMKDIAIANDSIAYRDTGRRAAPDRRPLQRVRRPPAKRRNHRHHLSRGPRAGAFPLMDIVNNALVHPGQVPLDGRTEGDAKSGDGCRKG